MLYEVITVFRKLSGLAIMPLVKLYLSNDEIGVWILLETLFMFVMVISALGVKSGFARWYYEMKNESRITSYNVCYTKLLRFLTCTY